MSDTRHPAETRTPAEPGLWLFVFGDLLLFSFLFATYYGYRSQDLPGFSGGQHHLSAGRGLVYTLLMLTSSLFVAAAVTGCNRRSRRRSVHLIDAAVFCGALFVLLKVLEYGHLSALASSDNNFWIMYFALTGMHLGHVLIGLGALIFARVLLARSPLDEHQMRILEGFGIFWHLVDALWVVLFSMLFLAR